VTMSVSDGITLHTITCTRTYVSQFKNNYFTEMCSGSEAGSYCQRRNHLAYHHLHPERDSFIDNLLVRIHFIIVMIRWTGLAPRESEFPAAGHRTERAGQPGKGLRFTVHGFHCYLKLTKVPLLL